MGIDVEVYIEAADEVAKSLDFYSEDWGLEAARFGPEGATHRVLTLDRYYGIAYERGNWPMICADLMELMQNPDVKRVWYFGDNSDSDGMAPITIEDVLRISTHYMKHGCRPYRDSEYRKAMTSRSSG